MMHSWNTIWKKKFIDPVKLPEKISELRSSGQKIATLNGSFDLLHAGHLHMIHEASQVADILIVALNTDRSIQEYKSPLRPIISLESRLQMMAALEFVDFVTCFDEVDPRNILEIIKPNIHVNGAEYGSNCIEADTVLKHGGKIHIVSLIPGLSTSQIIHKITSTTDKKGSDRCD